MARTKHSSSRLSTGAKAPRKLLATKALRKSAPSPNAKFVSMSEYQAAVPTSFATLRQRQDTDHNTNKCNWQPQGANANHSNKNTALKYTSKALSIRRQIRNTSEDSSSSSPSSSDDEDSDNEATDDSDDGPTVIVSCNHNNRKRGRANDSEEESSDDDVAPPSKKRKLAQNGNNDDCDLLSRLSQQKGVMNELMDGVIKETMKERSVWRNELNASQSKLQSALKRNEELANELNHANTENKDNLQTIQTLRKEFQESVKQCNEAELKANRFEKEAKEQKAEKERSKKEVDELRRYNVTNLDRLSETELDELKRKFMVNIQKIDEAKNRLVEAQLYCIVCTEKKKNIVLLPCHHMDLCSECHSRLEKKECPQCRVPIQSVIQTKM